MIMRRVSVLLLLVIGGGVAANPVAQQDQLVVDAQCFTLEALWGRSLFVGINRVEHWATRRDGLGILDDAPGRVSEYVRNVCSTATAAGMDLEPFFSLASAVPPFVEDNSEWRVETSSAVRLVSHFDGIALNVIDADDSGGVQHIVCAGDDFALVGDFGKTPVMWVEPGSVDNLDFYDTLMAPFPRSSGPEGTWLLNGPWVGEVGVAPYSGNPRVALRSVVPDSPEDAVGSHLYIFEEVAGAMVPVLSFVSTDGEGAGYSWCAYRYGLQPAPDGGMMPFPYSLVEFEVADEFLTTKKTAIRYNGQVDSLDAVKFPYASGAELWPNPGVLAEGESSTFNAGDPASWPDRIRGFLAEF